ncbi:MAG: hypothetical protein U0Q12_19235 [Vicinamibacterales bacterium]
MSTAIRPMMRTLLVMAAAATPIPGAAQVLFHQPDARQDAGYLASAPVGDVVRMYDPERLTTSVELTVAPQGPGGLPASLRLTFGVAFKGRELTAPVESVDVRAHAGPTSDSRVRRSTSLSFDLNAGTSKSLRLFYFGSSWGYGGFTPPGDELPLVHFALTAAELRTIAKADAVEGEALGFRYELTSRDLESLRAFLQVLQEGLEEGQAAQDGPQSGAEGGKGGQVLP